MPETLTPKQSKILEYIEQEIAISGCPPTLRQIAKHFGYAAVGTVEDHVRALIKKGYIEKEAGAHCGLRLTYQATSTSIPILGSVPAGRPIEAIEDAQGSLSVSLSHAGGGGLGGMRARTSGRGEYYALKVRGDSMIDAGILDGDFVIVRKQDDALNGEIVVALIDGEATVKRLEKKQGRVRLIAENPRYSPIELVPGQVNLIQGKVVGLQRFY